MKNNLEEKFKYVNLLLLSFRHMVREINLSNDVTYNTYLNYRKISLFLVGERDDSLRACRQLIDMSCIDYPDRQNRFIIWYTSMSHVFHVRVNYFTSVKERLLAISSAHVFRSLNGAEREVWDLFGVPFTGHEDLRRILTDYGFKGFPLRKNYPMIGYGEIGWDQSQNRIVKDLVEMMQASRRVISYLDFKVKYFHKSQLERLVEDMVPLCEQYLKKKKLPKFHFLNLLPINGKLKGRKLLVLLVSGCLTIVTVGLTVYILTLPPEIGLALKYNLSHQSVNDHIEWQRLGGPIREHYKDVLRILDKIHQTTETFKALGQIDFTVEQLTFMTRKITEFLEIYSKASNFLIEHPYLHIFGERSQELQEMAATEGGLKQVLHHLLENLQQQQKILALENQTTVLEQSIAIEIDGLKRLEFSYQLLLKEIESNKALMESDQLRWIIAKNLVGAAVLVRALTEIGAMRRP